jgi:nucleotide-binding universal stress UspA family protein
VDDSAVVGWDGSDGASRAVEWAATRQDLSGGSLAIVRVVDSEREDAAERTRAVGAARMALLAQVARTEGAHRGLRVVSHVIEGDPFDTLRSLSRTTNLLAVGSSGPGRRGDRRHATLAARLVATAEGPVAVVPLQPPERRDIVVGVDGTGSSLAALAFAAREALRWGDTLVAVHAWLLPVNADFAAGVDTDGTDLLRHQHESLLRESLARTVHDHPSLRIRPRVVQGLASRVLLDAGRDARMLVVGNHGRRRIARFLLGSVSRIAVMTLVSATVVVREPSGRIPQTWSIEPQRERDVAGGAATVVAADVTTPGAVPSR